MEIQDHMITKEDFKVEACSNCGFYFTNPIPSLNEIGRYYKSENYISHSSTSKGFVNKIYNVVRDITLKQKLKLVKSLTKGVDLLDIGAGTGHFLNTCVKADLNVLGLEPDEDARLFAKTNFDLDLESTSVLNDLPSNSRDVITMWHVLEHVYNLKEDLSEVERILKQDGVLIIAVPNMGSYDAKKYGPFWAAFDVPRHLYHFQKNTIEQLMLQFDLKLEKTLPMKFDAYYVSMLSEQYKGGNIISAFLTGLKSNLKASKYGYSSQIYIFKKK